MARYRKSPIRPGKKYEVIKATTKDIDGIDLGNRKYKFGPNGSMYINDSGVAKEIEQEYGHIKGNGDVVVSPVTISDGQKHFFGTPTSKQYAENYDRIFGGKNGRKVDSAVSDNSKI